MNIRMVKTIAFAFLMSFLMSAKAGQPKKNTESSENSEGSLVLVVCAVTGTYCLYRILSSCINRAQESVISSMALSRAVNCGGDEEAVARILQKNKGVLGKDAALIVAARKGHRAIAMRLINAGASIDQRDSDGKTPLIHAAERGCMHVARGLIRRGADLCIQDSKGQTALSIALRHGHSDLAKVLIYQGVPIDYSDSKHRMTPLMWAAQGGLTDVMKVLLGDTSDDPEELADPFTGRIDIHARNAEGDTALLLAVQNGRSKAAKMLIDAGANPNDCDNQERKTVLMWAAQRGLGELVSMLVQGVSNVNAQDEHGNTAEDLAKINRHPEVADILFNYRVAS